MGPPDSAAHYFDNLDLLIITLQCHPTSGVTIPGVEPIPDYDSSLFLK